MAKTIGADLKTGEVVFNAFWEAALPLKLLKDKLNAYWEKTGKKFVLGIDGRKVPTRSAHAILNSLFQSAGVLCAKRAMVLHDRKLRTEGYAVDFFKDDWKNMKFCQQMVAYHDEEGLEVSKELVKFKIFSWKDLGRQIFEDEEEQTKEDARCKAIVTEWKKQEEANTGKIWSDVTKSPKGGYFVAYTRPGELASQSVKEAGQYYNLNVELTAGYVIGRSWCDTH